MDKLLDKLLANDIYIFNENDNLKIKYNGEQIPVDILAEIKLHKEDLLKYLKKYDTQSAHQLIERVAQNESYALSSAQKRLWILCQLEEGSIAYNLPSYQLLDGYYNTDSLKQAIYATLERHEILRTIFREDESGNVRQWILDVKDLDFNISYLDYSSFEADERTAKLTAYIQHDSVKPFNLRQGPLFRAALICMSDSSYVFYYNMHHIISDGWSMDVLGKDVLSFYEAIEKGKECTLPELRIQYKDYANWQLNQVEKEPRFRTYWTNQLAGILPVLALPTFKKRPAVKTSNGSRLTTYISKELSQKLKLFSQERKGSLFMGLLATMNALLYRYTSQEDLIIGTPVAGRDHVDLENQLGFYVNTLALRNQVTATDSFEDLFERIKISTLEAYEHKAYPFDHLIEELKLKRDISRNVVFDVMLTLHNIEDKGRRCEPAEQEADRILDHNGIHVSKFDLEYNFEAHGELLYFDVTYNTDIYERDMIAGFMQHFKQLLHELLASPDQKINKLDYLLPEERSLVLKTFNDTKTDYPEELTVLDLFKLRVAENPDKIAVVYEDHELTYRELDERSNQLAHHLLEKGVAKEELVMVCLQRSLKMVIGILAILKSGAAYVPVDPAYPQERISYLLEDTTVKVILSDSAHLDLFDASAVVNLDTFNYSLYSSTLPDLDISSHQLAYCIYTSGTTGKPKGVLNRHDGLLNRLFWMRDQLNITEDAVLLQKTPYVFDVSVWEFTMPLITGCKLVVAAPGGHSDPDYLLHVIEKERVTILHFVPSMLGIFLEFVKRDKVRSIQHVVCSGEALPPVMVARFKQLLPDVRIHNLYGPTEAAIDVTAIDLTGIDTLKHGVYIGKPVANTQLYIVNDAIRLQPMGVIGELLIGGIQVASGYLNKRELTTERFIEDVFTGKTHLYRTGDLVRWLPDGNIEYMGRKDDQVKIRGYRIELNEIESQLALKTDIREVIVLAPEFPDQERKLVAYFVSEKEEVTSDLRSYLMKKLPGYMVPEIYIQLTEMPVTTNGKIDRRALPGPEGFDLSSTVAYVAPATVLECKLAEIWEELLDMAPIGIKNDFFAMGGHSLKAIQLISRIDQEFGVKMNLITLFNEPTIEKVAEEIENAMWANRELVVVDNANIEKFVL